MSVIFLARHIIMMRYSGQTIKIIKFYFAIPCKGTIVRRNRSVELPVFWLVDEFHCRGTLIFILSRCGIFQYLRISSSFNLI